MSMPPKMPLPTITVEQGLGKIAAQIEELKSEITALRRDIALIPEAVKKVLGK